MVKGIIIAVALACSGAARAAAYTDAVTVDGDTIRVAEAAAAHIKGDGLSTILMQAASAPVFDADGDQVGYRLSEIDAGSVYETLGLQDGDVVLEIEGMTLSDPRRAVDLLRYARGLDAFDVLLERAGTRRLVHVVIGQR